MAAFDEFEHDVREALGHLHDPLFIPPPSLAALAESGLQALLIAEIEELRPQDSAPSIARSRRMYDILVERYVHQLTQEQTAERIGVTERHLRREQQMAIHLLAGRLWQRLHGEAAPQEATDETLSEDEQEWRSQVRQELQSLQASATAENADVADTVNSALRLLAPVLAPQGIACTADVAPGLLVAQQPVVVRQIIVAATMAVASAVPGGSVALTARDGATNITICISGAPVTGTIHEDTGFLDELLAHQGGSLSWDMPDQAAVCSLVLPAAQRVKVLVVDDNADIVHFYQRYVQLTRFTITVLNSGETLLDQIATIAPDIIVLDVMLPGVDGWELLSHLHQHPATRAVPVIVCSVMRQESLALALGAVLYLPKPVRRQDFLRALDTAFSLRAAAPSPTS